MVAEYKLGQVDDIKVGRDGLVRVVRIRTLSKNENKFVYLDRPIHKLCVIVPVEEQKGIQHYSGRECINRRFLFRNAVIHFLFPLPRYEINLEEQTTYRKITIH